MEALDNTTWDVVILGTGLPQSLLALALSRSGKKILHLDRSEYYGGDEAALSVSEAETWAEKHKNDDSATFSNASTEVAPSIGSGSGTATLSSSRAYSLSFNPALIYTRSNLLPAFVSSRVHNQLEFQAVGSWFVYHAATSASYLPEGKSQLLRVPSGREDVFADKTIDLKSKGKLMRLLRFIAAYEEKVNEWESQKDMPLPDFLERKFGLHRSAHPPLLALALSPLPPQGTTVGIALPRIARHLRSIGIFGPGFGAVMPKWGGLAEISQVACRACAVGGGVYVLNKSVEEVACTNNGKATVTLGGGEKITSTWLVAVDNRFSSRDQSPLQNPANIVSKSIYIVASPLQHLFPPTSEGGPTPAGAVVVIPSENGGPPVHVLAHSSDSGECPQGQCVLYACIALMHAEAYPLLDVAVEKLLTAVDDGENAKVLWRMQYQHCSHPTPVVEASGLVMSSPVIKLQPVPLDLTLKDSVLENVEMAWKRIMGNDADGDQFMKFEQRGGEEDEGFS